jgi:regulatory protein
VSPAGRPRPATAYLAGIAALARRECSSSALRERLVRLGFEAHEIDRAIDRLTHEGRLDDRRAALSIARAAARRGRGPARIRRELAAAGIAAELVRESLDGVFAEGSEENEVDRLLARRLGGRTAGPVECRKLYRWLVGRGFRPALVIARVRLVGRARFEVGDEE